ncbi:hypothetical protein QJS04_geneDACA009178 [Acorus gramineus]|uniref:Protein EI24 homolog n=1 Tax=Acorus gramineus TaxID=55184 RepID=A0AAV9ATQ6_ACOGR|nr:hypothetical protein QJS04_geneDACA009178 [Acorus gramineus]
MEKLKTYVKQAILMWLAGFREACCLHRVFIFCSRSKTLLKRTGQCFLLNGLIFLGSLFMLNSVVIPILLWILPGQCERFGSRDICDAGVLLKFYSASRFILIELFYVLWFYPLYIFSFILSNIWYNDIAKNAFAVMEGSSIEGEILSSEGAKHSDRPAGVDGVIIGIGEQMFSVLLLSFFFIEVFATGFLPRIGKPINFVLLSWMYSYYCFEYKWNYFEMSLEKRLNFFESNWAFFAGFGSPCVLAIFFFSPLVSYGVMAILFPLFVLTATGTQAEKVINHQQRSWNGCRLGKLPIFYAANNFSLQVLQIWKNDKEQ